MQKTNPVLRNTIAKLEEAGRKNDASVYTRAAEELKKSEKNKVEVNVSRIQRHAEDGDTVLVPGKLLGSGRLDKDVEVAAFDATSSAKKIVKESGDFKFIEDLVKENPEGKKVKLMV